MKKFLIIPIILLLLSPLALAQITEEQLSLAKQFQGQELPGIAKKLFSKNEIVNIYIGEQTFNIAVQEHVVQELNQGLSENPTIDVIVTENAFNKLLSSEASGETFKELLDSKEIQLKPYGFFKKMKFGLAKWIATTFL